MADSGDGVGVRRRVGGLGVLRSRPAFVALAVLTLLVGGGGMPAEPAAPVIVLLRPAAAPVGARARQVADELGARNGWRASHVYAHTIDGFAARLTSAQQTALRRDPRVSAIVPDELIELVEHEDAEPIVDTTTGETPANIQSTPSSEPTPSVAPDPTPTPAPTATPRTKPPTPGPARQIVPTGVRRIGRPALNAWPINGANLQVNIDIAIVDTGVSPHPDLNLVGGKNCIGGRKWHDGNGHGTHVAGTAAALDNDFGVVGVAPGARIWSVKVLNKYGRGYASWLLCGIDWITAQREGGRAMIEVANLSLRFRGAERPADDGNCGQIIGDAIHRATCRSVGRGTIYVAAAGNDRRNAANYRPAGYREVITVSALSDFDGRPGAKGNLLDVCPAGWTRDRDDRMLRVSNFGRVIQIMAPGKCIWSTNRNGGYRQMSGTSMATPHVAGAVALYLLHYPDASANAIRAALIACGTQDWVHASDRDSWHEPLLNLDVMCAPEPPT